MQSKGRISVCLLHLDAFKESGTNPFLNCLDTSPLYSFKGCGSWVQGCRGEATTKTAKLKRALSSHRLQVSSESGFHAALLLWHLGQFKYFGNLQRGLQDIHTKYTGELVKWRLFYFILFGMAMKRRNFIFFRWINFYRGWVCRSLHMCFFKILQDS